MARASWGCLVWAVALVVLAGCPGTQTGLDTVPVSATVTLDGQPVAGASVTFKPKAADGRAASGVTDAAGRVTLTTLQSGDGALPGSYAVGITKITGPAAASGVEGGDPTSKEAVKQQMEAMKQRMKKKMSEGPGGERPVTTNLLPEKYASLETSGFTAEVKKGEKNEFTFAMTSE